METQKFDQLSALLSSVFAVQPGEAWLTIMVDLPDARMSDNEAWLDRRRIARGWFELLDSNRHRLPFSAIVFCTYPNVGSNNNELPDTVTVTVGGDGQATPGEAEAMQLGAVLGSSSVVLAPTELSATAPLKLLAKEYGFRGATLPGFSRAMIPALMLDYEQVNARVMEFKERMDRADGFAVSMAASGQSFAALFDLRFRMGHASGGLMRQAGMVGNLPSGEAYVVPYEGEREGEPSRTAGELPVQFGDEIVVYRIEGNRAVAVVTSGPSSDAERRRLQAEPAYGNMAEVGIGVLGEWGVQAVGVTLLDEKLGLHIAFGRSDHFGGVTGPASFREPANVVHIDRVYVESTQPDIQVREASFEYTDGTREVIITNGRYVV